MFAGSRVRGRRGDVRRGRLQHRHGRLPGGADRSVVRGSDRHDDRSAAGELRREPRGRRVGPGAGGGVRRAGGLAPRLQLAGRRQRLPTELATAGRGRDRGDRHAAADAPAARTGRDARGDLHDRPRPRLAGRTASRTRRGWRAPISRERCRPPEPYEAATLVGPVDRSHGAVFRVAAYDFGMKRNILRRLAATGCETTVFPAETPAAEIAAGGFDGVFLSNGPGDPAVTAVRHRRRPGAARQGADLRDLPGPPAARARPRWDGRSRCGSATEV